eukprot:1424641-Rhodomonas_salina.1
MWPGSSAEIAGFVPDGVVIITEGGGFEEKIKNPDTGGGQEPHCRGIGHGGGGGTQAQLLPDHEKG